jgi:hypothetical protein
MFYKQILTWSFFAGGGSLNDVMVQGLARLIFKELLLQESEQPISPQMQSEVVLKHLRYALNGTLLGESVVRNLYRKSHY